MPTWPLAPRTASTRCGRNCCVPRPSRIAIRATAPTTVSRRSSTTTSLTRIRPNSSQWTPSLQPFITIGEVYSYPPQYAKIYAEYNATPARPVFMEEANYEFENNTGNDPSSNLVLRKQEYWSILSGALAGQMYGNLYTVALES